MFIIHGIPSFYKLLRTSIYRFADQNLNSIIMECMTPIAYIHSPIRHWWRSVENESIEIRPFDIVNVLKNVNKGKACGVDGLAAEHFIYADERIHVILSILFNCFISYGYLPSEFIKTAIVPIIKNKTGDTSDKRNYRPIALVTACSKFF